MLGCGGMLGEAFYHIFRDDFDVKATDIDVNEPWLSSLDVREYEAIRSVVNDIKPDFI